MSQHLATHPAMYAYFHVQRQPLAAYDDFNQTQSGLMLIDTTNRTARDLLFQKWADCARNEDCISPHNVYTLLFSRQMNHFNGSEYR